MAADDRERTASSHRERKRPKVPRTLALTDSDCLRRRESFLLVAAS
jgi:hypothetical protein